MKKGTKIRPMGDILLDMEPFIQELFDDHDIQHGDFIMMMHGYAMIHYPGHAEEYEDGSRPILYYTHKHYLRGER